MSSFTITLADLEASGPVINVELSVSAAYAQVLKAAGLPIPGPLNVAALIDTGADATVVQSGLAAQLGLAATRMVLASTPTSKNERLPVHYMRVAFDHSTSWEGSVIEASLPLQSVKCLVGRDILAGASLEYRGRENTFTIEF